MVQCQAISCPGAGGRPGTRRGLRNGVHTKKWGGGPGAVGPLGAPTDLGNHVPARYEAR